MLRKRFPQNLLEPRLSSIMSRSNNEYTLLSKCHSVNNDLIRHQTERPKQTYHKPQREKVSIHIEVAAVSFDDFNLVTIIERLFS